RPGSLEMSGDCENESWAGGVEDDSLLLKPAWPRRQSYNCKGRLVCSMNESRKYGCSFSQVNSAVTRRRRCAVSHGAKLASRPYLVQAHTPSSGFNSGTYPGKSSATTRGSFFRNALTSRARLWMLCRSQITVSRGNDSFSSRKKATMCSAVALLPSGNRWKNKPGTYRCGLRVMQLMALMRSRRSQHGSTGVC